MTDTRFVPVHLPELTPEPRVFNAAETLAALRIIMQTGQLGPHGLDAVFAATRIIERGIREGVV